MEEAEADELLPVQAGAAAADGRRLQVRTVPSCEQKRGRPLQEHAAPAGGRRRSSGRGEVELLLLWSCGGPNRSSVSGGPEARPGTI